MKNKFVFGPVLSRRLGISLGVDIVPHKSCTYNCIYCECGPTTLLTDKRKEYVPAEKVISELNKTLCKSPDLDYITFSGSGEPTLNSSLGKIINFIKKKYPNYKIAVLTNGSLLYHDEVRRDISRADLIIPSIDAASRDVYEKINRPCEEVSQQKLFEGIKKTVRELDAKVWLEVFIISSLNDSRSELKRIKKVLQNLKPDRIHLNTLDRPGTEKNMRPASLENLKRVQHFLRPLESRIIPAAGETKPRLGNTENLKEKIMAVIVRRPSTFKDLKTVFAPDEEKLKKYLQELENSGRIHSIKKERGVFYRKS